jgi:hypothetical protein
MKFGLMSALVCSVAVLPGCGSPHDATMPPPAPALVSLPDVVRDGETYAFRDWYGEPAPSALLTCPEETEYRLPISGRCVGVVDYDSLPPRIAATEFPGCGWVYTEADFGSEALVFRAMGCSDQVTTLDYGGGAHAAELIYAVSAPYGDELKDHVAVRIATYWGDDTFRLRETIPDEGADACQILPAGESYPDGAMIIVPMGDTPAETCGNYAVSDAFDNFWLVSADKAFVYAFSLPVAGWDIDPFSFERVTPN